MSIRYNDLVIALSMTSSLKVVLATRNLFRATKRISEITACDTPQAYDHGNVLSQVDCLETLLSYSPGGDTASFLTHFQRRQSAEVVLSLSGV